MRFLYLRWCWKRTRVALLVVTVVWVVSMLTGLNDLPELMHDRGRPDLLGDVLVLVPMFMAMLVKIWMMIGVGKTFWMTRPVSRASLIWTPWALMGAESAAGMLVCMALVAARLWGHPGMEVMQSPETWLWGVGGVVNGLVMVGISSMLALPTRMGQSGDSLGTLLFVLAIRVPWLQHFLFVWPWRGLAAFSMGSLWLHLGLAVGLAAAAQWLLERRDVSLPGVQLTALRG